MQDFHFRSGKIVELRNLNDLTADTVLWVAVSRGRAGVFFLKSHAISVYCFKPVHLKSVFTVQVSHLFNLTSVNTDLSKFQDEASD